MYHDMPWSLSSLLVLQAQLNAEKAQRVDLETEASHRLSEVTSQLAQHAEALHAAQQADIESRQLAETALQRSIDEKVCILI